MPSYAYTCTECGPFTAQASMLRYAEPAPCPSCGRSAARRLTTPFFATGARQEGATPAGEKAPAHAFGCACCR